MKPRQHGLRGDFRIIGGAWRRRRFDFVTDRDVRPSPDRVRETLFNWLAPVIAQARCLDLFAGSGALGLEALSRGAAQVLFVDHERSVIERIRAHLATLGATARAQLLQAEAAQYLRQGGGPFDIVFLDPPFRQGLVPPLLAQLPPLLAPDHRVYVETETPPPALPPGWETLKSARAGQVSFALVRFTANPHNP
ncbi:MAG TPA: 16S rRNA (guanine(966)-N(2))-methyltransferase RsmD [Nevskiales bacterium]|nr:16S rRNA (guanine(966)-N(2))-methyltransferase RsmD [Nevskiales bacterium]